MLPQPVTVSSVFADTSLKSVRKHAGRTYSVNSIRSPTRSRAISFFFCNDEYSGCLYISYGSSRE